MRTPSMKNLLKTASFGMMGTSSNARSTTTPVDDFSFSDKGLNDQDWTSISLDSENPADRHGVVELSDVTLT